MSKKGYFFIVDSLIAIFILATGVYLLQSTYLSVPQVSNTVQVAGDVIDLLNTAKVNEFWPLDSNLNSIKNKKNTLLEAIGESYKNDSTIINTHTAYKIVDTYIIQNHIIDPNKYGFRILINNTEIRAGGEEFEEKSKSKVVVRRFVFGYKKGTNPSKPLEIFPWGPYEIKVESWELK